MAIEVAALAAFPEGQGLPLPEQDSDADLIRRLIEGSHDAVAALYDRYSAAVFRRALRSGADGSTAEEVVQETFLTLWNRAEQFDASRGSLATWLMVIARNRTFDHLRAAGRRPATVPFSSFVGEETDEDWSIQWLETAGQLIAAAAPEPEPEDAIAAREASASVAAGLDALGLPERQVILLAYQDGLSQSEIATRLGWPLGTVKTRTRRAYRQLRDRLEQSPSCA
jgi:RNA polymerase sigma-70 factor (ECF subfamily)